MDRRRVLGLARAVRNGKSEAIDLVSPRVETKLLAEESQEWNYPRVARYRSAEVRLWQSLKASSKDTPKRTGICEDGRNLVGHRPATFQAEVRGPLPN